MYFLIILPFTAILFDAIYGLIKNGVVPPIGESLAKFTWVQVITIVVTLIARGESGDIVNMGVFVFIVLILILSLYIWISKTQEEDTRERIKLIFDSMITPKPGGVDVNLLRDLGDKLVDPDFLENSIANKLSRYKRRYWREKYVQLLRESATVNNNIQESTLLVIERHRALSITVNKIAFLTSALVFLFYIGFFIVYTF